MVGYHYYVWKSWESHYWRCRTASNVRRTAIMVARFREKRQLGYFCQPFATENLTSAASASYLLHFGRRFQSLTFVGLHIKDKNAGLHFASVARHDKSSNPDVAHNSRTVYLTSVHGVNIVRIASHNRGTESINGCRSERATGLVVRRCDVRRTQWDTVSRSRCSRRLVFRRGGSAAAVCHRRLFAEPTASAAGFTSVLRTDHLSTLRLSFFLYFCQCVSVNFTRSLM